MHDAAYVIEGIRIADKSHLPTAECGHSAYVIEDISGAISSPSQQEAGGTQETLLCSSHFL
ncbi:hypothetical protein E4U25_004718 [Claviceps purpurea]|nr:hypothetical protein E4U25_004718 [Claviceps purpurea]